MMFNKRCIGVVAIVCFGTLIAGCSGGNGHNSSPTSSTTTTVPVPTYCIPLQRFWGNMGDVGLTFTNLVNADQLDEKQHQMLLGVGQGMAVVEPNADLGAYGPALDYLAQLTSTDSGTDPPKRTPEVVASAKRLDDDLSKGECRG